MDDEPTDLVVCPLSRRAVLMGAGAAAVAMLTGCTTYGPGGPADATTEPEEEEPTDEATEPGSTPAPLAQTTEIPVGGGKVFDRKRVVVTQPRNGDFKAFTAVCPHQRNLVGSVEDGVIKCPSHGSQFRIADGSVARGPATQPLREVDITVNGTDIRLA